MSSTQVRTSPLPAQAISSNKRKRGLEDIGRNPDMDNANGDGGDPNYAALLQGISNENLAADESTRTAQAALAAPMATQYPEHPTFDNSPGMTSAFDQSTPTAPGATMGSMTQSSPYQARGSSSKPAVGTTEWHQQRKDNHKEVERRRREVINEGIENIAKLVPNAEKNKGAILMRTHEYVLELQNSIKAFDNERATFEIALKELTSRNEKLKESSRQAWQETAKWQQRCRDAGLDFDDYDAFGSLDGVDGTGD